MTTHKCDKNIKSAKNLQLYKFCFLFLPPTRLFRQQNNHIRFKKSAEWDLPYYMKNNNYYIKNYNQHILFCFFASQELLRIITENILVQVFFSVIHKNYFFGLIFWFCLPLQEEAYTLFFTNQNWYLFLRLHAILCERLLKIYERSQIIAAEEAIYKSSRSESTATALKLKPKSDIKIEDYYPTFLDMLKNVLDGNMDASNYEDTLREMFGIHAYIAFTLDRVRIFGNLT